MLLVLLRSMCAVVVVVASIVCRGYGLSEQ